MAAGGASTAVDAGGVVRGRDGATVFTGWDFGAAGCDEVNREKSSRMLRAASQPARINKAAPTPTVCLIRLLIVIPPT